MTEMFGQPCVVRGPRPYVDEQYTFKFDNGWGASVIRGEASFGSWELAVFGPDGEINYEHPVSQGDVVRGSEEEIAQWLQEIKDTQTEEAK